MCPLIYSKFAYAISVNEISSPDLVCMQRIKSMQISTTWAIVCMRWKQINVYDTFTGNMCVHCTRMEGKHTNGVLKVKIAITLRDCCAFSLLHLLFSRSLFINACEISLFAVAFLRSNVHVCVWVYGWCFAILIKYLCFACSHV